MGVAQQQSLFTLAEATALLPWLRVRLQRLQALKREHDDTVRRLAGMTPAMRSNGSAVLGAQLETRLDTLIQEIRDSLLEITDVGVEVKDIDTGLVDFPALRGSRVVYLCWRLGEETIGYWHELDAGFAGRQPLD
ncbi:MAG: DUF2203 domain-containing protein [Chloroflexi bacterium]|nr:MAG: DUF2203 domain-containing protein [Chloroflexota bacterium]